MGMEEKAGEKQTKLIYDKNMVALKKNSPTLWAGIQGLESEENSFLKECVKAKDGNDILVIKKENQVYRLNSLYAPLRESVSWAQGISLGTIEQINILYGLGNGLSVRELLRLMQQGNMLVVFEPSLEIFQFVLKNYDISDILTNPKFCLIVSGINEKALYKVWEYGFGKVNASENPILSLPQYIGIFAEEYKQFCEKCKEHKKEALVMQNTILYLSAFSVKNILHNLKYFLKSKSFEALKSNIPKDVTAIMVAAGPSLKENLQVLKRAKGKFLIIAVERVLDTLIDNGIEPDFIATLDPVKPVTPRMKNGNVHIPAIVLPETSIEFMECHKGEKIICNNGGLYAGLRESVGIHERVVHSDGSVATFMFSALLEMGVKRIVFVGQDLAFGEHGAYADNHKFVQSENPFGEYIQAEGVNGETVYSRQDWMRFARFFEENIKTHPEVDFVDVKTSGLKIHGTRHMELEDVTEQYCCENVDVAEIMEKTKDLFFGEKGVCVQKALMAIKEDLTKCKSILDELILKCEDKGPIEEIAGLSQELEKIDIMNFFNDLIMYRTIKEQKALGSLGANDDTTLDIMNKIFQETRNIVEEHINEFANILEKTVWN